jgi:hypothetical protein
MLMKTWAFLFSGVLLALMTGRIHGQMDTLYYDDFVDDRNAWEADGEWGKQVVRDGHLEINYVKGGHHLGWVGLPLAAGVDSFIYEIRLRPDFMRYGGMVFNLCHTAKRKKISAYTGVCANLKSAYCFEYDAFDASSTPQWEKKGQFTDLKDATYRVAYGSGTYYFYVNGVMVKAAAFKKISMLARGREGMWEKWGWFVAGKAKVRVDYLMLLVKQ